MTVTVGTPASRASASDEDVPIRTDALRKVFRSGGGVKAGPTSPVGRSTGSAPAGGGTARGGDVVAVDGVDLTVKYGEFFGLLGPNGAGKSTTIGMLTTRVLPTSGRAFVAGIDVVRRPAEAKRVIGVVPQTNTLDRQLTVAENLEFHGRYFGLSARVARARAGELLEQFTLADRADASVYTLSGGMAQRLMVARALVHRPQILFLDEPTSGIDPQTRLRLWDLLRGLHAEGQTILLTTHYMEEAETLCQRVAIVDHGRVLADGSPAELRRGLGADTVFTLRLRGEQLERLRDLAADRPGGTKAELEPAAADGVATLRVYAADGEGLLAELIIAAERADVRVLDAATTPPSLESVFLALTGRELRE